MIANIVKPGHKTRGVLNYLYGPGRANEHTDPHLIASWDGFAPDPGRDSEATLAQLTTALDLRVKQARDKAPKEHMWHCSVRAAPEDRALSDEEWATVARRVLNTAGIAPDGDPDACRWVAVRHAEDHIHIVATKVRGDLRPARTTSCAPTRNSSPSRRNTGSARFRAETATPPNAPPALSRRRPAARAMPAPPASICAPSPAQQSRRP